ncbi:MAG: hypothetical protein M1828_005102 [Chrysothrix sp. TS-e1954]|nr:MAG: hypothetical protein M1828_005102 [Chrysothrix sp. TS-e1954]
MSAKRAEYISPPPLKRRKLDEAASETSDMDNETHDGNSDPQHESLRIFSWNINGIAPFLQRSMDSFVKKQSADSVSAPSLRVFLKRHRWPQILHLQEVKVKASDRATKLAVERAVNSPSHDPDHGPPYAVRFCLPSNRFHGIGAGGKTYGVATVIRLDYLQNVVTQVREVSWDDEGRVLVIETNSNLSLWNIYAVNGTSSPWRDPQSGKIIGTRHDKKLSFHQKLLEECKMLETQGWNLVLSGDLNVAREPIDGFPRLRTRPEQHVQNRKDFNCKFFDDADGLRAVDSFRYMHPTLRKYTWISTNQDWLASCDRVDYILLSRRLVEQSKTLVEAEILMTPLDRGPSDHVPLSVTLNMQKQKRLR